MLADLGARVIKIDATDKRLDEGRRSTAAALADVRTYAGKESMQVDLQTPRAKRSCTS
jgi:crotonobetainyl-CoA:carnitine CoA-transferase CaiB-like acyl-CoA transferase